MEMTDDPEEYQRMKQVIKDKLEHETARYLARVNAGRRNDQVQVNELVLVKIEHYVGPVSPKLKPRWRGPYKVIQVLRDGGAYVLEHVFTQQRIQRAAGKIKRYHHAEGILVDPLEDLEEQSEPEEEQEERRRTGRTRTQPERLQYS